MKARVGDGSKLLVDPLLYVDMIDLIPTMRSRETSGAKLKEMFVGTYFEMSEPPNVRVPKLPLDPGICQCGPSKIKTSYDSALPQYKPS